MAASRERIAIRIKNERERRGLDPLDLAVAIGVNPRTLERWEEGKTTPQLKHAKALAEKFDRPVTDFRPDLQAEEEAILERLTQLERKVDIVLKVVAPDQAAELADELAGPIEELVQADEPQPATPARAQS